MPAAGEQHKANGSTTTNPFEETQPRISEYTAQEIATIQSRLDKQLGPEYISSRPGPGGQKVHYLAAEKVINLANEVFGFNGWSSSIRNIQIDFVDENVQTGKISLGIGVTMRVTLKDGTYHEDIGYGHVENCKGKAAAFDKAKKEGTTDGLKRALRNFGNVLGMCIYDKDFVARVTKIKIAPSKWDAENLHRHVDYAPTPAPAPAGKENMQLEDDVKVNGDSSHISYTEAEDDFGIADFDDADFGESSNGHPDEIILPSDNRHDRGTAGNGYTHNRPQQSRPGGVIQPKSAIITPSKPPNVASRMPAGPAAMSANLPQQRMQPPASHVLQPQAGQARPMPTTRNQPQASVDTHDSSSPGLPSQHFAQQSPQQNGAQQAPPQIPSIGFYSARAAQVSAEGNGTAAPSVNLPKFDPHAESPSIRKTAGVDHRRSVPLKRGLTPATVIPVPPAPDGAPLHANAARDFVNPSTDMHRRIGAPGTTMHSPANKGSMNASAYRPLTRRAPETSLAGGALGDSAATSGVGKRPVLVDVSNMQQTFIGADGNEAKRQKVSGPEDGVQGQNTTGAR